MMPKSKKKEKFEFLKQILEYSSSDRENDEKKFTTEASTQSDRSVQTESQRKEKGSTGPVGKYPVLFKKTCRNKSCQTRLSSFPLFPLPEDTEWISDEEGEKKKKYSTLKKKRRQNKLVSREANKDHDVVQHDIETDFRLSKVKNSDGTRKSFRSEHQLKETDNPILQAWLHKKAIVFRKQRKLERKEKRAKRAALEEEARMQAERAIESNEKVGDWLKRKQKEARMVWRKSRTRVTPQQVDSTSQRDGLSLPPPPEYRVVKSFKYRKPSSGHLRDNDHSKDGSNSMNGAIPGANPPMSSSNTKVDSKTSENTANHVKCRPKTAVDRTETVSLSHPTTAVKRPKTSRERSLKNPAVQTSVSDRVSTKTMQSLSYDQWLRVKRDADKDRTIQKKRDLIDSHLEAVIKELGKKRVEKIMSPRKQVDTGLKNVSRSPVPVPAQSDSSKAKRNNPYRWVLRKKPRPEPQGCDCPESHSTDGTTSVSCHQHTKNSGELKDANVVVQTSEKPKIHVCEELDEKYNELKPSIAKVKDILDSEIKKLKESGKGLGTNVDKPSQQSVDSSALLLSAGDDYSFKEPKLSRPMSARPSSARPATAQPSTARPGSAYLTKDQAKKIASDLDVLGLCDSDPEQEDEVNTDAGVGVKHDEKSTVRENYFDYGSDVDPPPCNQLNLLSN